MTASRLSIDSNNEVWTIEKLVDELFLCLAKSPNGFYYVQAEYLLHRIPIHRPAPFFEIKLSDLTSKIRHEIRDYLSNKKALDYILKTSVGRLFENLDVDYFHLSVKSKLRCRLIK
jgi:hypothetical protein